MFFSLPRKYNVDGDIYLIRDVLRDDGKPSGQCQYAVHDRTLTVIWKPCEEGVEFKDIAPLHKKGLSEMRDEAAIEKEIVEKGLNAPRLSPEKIDEQVRDINYWQVPGTACVVCAITLANGFVVTGKSAPVSSSNFDEHLGRTIAFKNAREQIWQLEGYLLKESLNPRS